MISVKSKEFSRKLLNRQKGFSILELLIVIGILGITSAFIYPSIGQWKIKRNIERDFQAVVSTIDYLKTRTRSVNGTSILRCDDGTDDMVMSYVISSQRNDAGGPGGVLDYPGGVSGEPSLLQRKPPSTSTTKTTTRTTTTTT